MKTLKLVSPRKAKNQAQNAGDDSPTRFKSDIDLKVEQLIRESRSNLEASDELSSDFPNGASPGRSGRKISRGSPSPRKDKVINTDNDYDTPQLSPFNSPSKPRKKYVFQSPNLSPVKPETKVSDIFNGSPKKTQNKLNNTPGNPFIDSPKIIKVIPKQLQDTTTTTSPDDDNYNAINDEIDEIEARLRLRSPLKRSMNDLNQSARKKAILRKAQFQEDGVEFDEDLSIVDRIIMESRNDGLGDVYHEEDEDEDEDEQGEERGKGDHVDVMKYRKAVSEEHQKSLVIDRNSSPNKKLRFQLHSVVNKTNNNNNDSPFKNNTFSPLKAKKEGIQLMKIPKIEKSSDSLLKARFDTDRSIFSDGYEGYFEQNKLAFKKSSSSMTQAPSLNYEEYHKYLTLMKFINFDQREKLIKYYKYQYPQFMFEILQGFNLLFYGLGSKRSITLDFVSKFLIPSFKRHTMANKQQPPHCIVMNGYNPETTIRNMLKIVYLNCFGIKAASFPLILHEIIPEMTEKFAQLAKQRQSKIKDKNSTNGHKIPELVLVIHNIDGDSFRQDKHQFFLSLLGNIPEITIIATMDNVNTPIFWNSDIINKFNFCWHALTTFETYSSETSFKDPLSIGKSNKFVGSKGAKYVLSSVTSNARALYRNLLIHQIEKIDSKLDSYTTATKNKIVRGTVKGALKYGINFKDFFTFCMDDFTTSNEINFRTILGEFCEHKMASLTKSTAGVEMIYVPFTVDEMEKMLTEELL